MPGKRAERERKQKRGFNEEENPPFQRRTNDVVCEAEERDRTIGVYGDDMPPQSRPAHSLAKPPYRPGRPAS